MSQQVKVEGTRTLYNLDDVRESVVRIANLYFWRDSEEIIKVEGRYFRKKSPLIVKDYHNNFILRSTAIELAPGTWAHPTDANAVKLEDGSWTSRNNAVQISERWYLVTDPRIGHNFYDAKIHGKTSYLLKENAIPLWEDAYGKDRFVPKSFKASLLLLDQGFILASDAVKYIDKSGQIVQTHTSVLAKLMKTEKFAKVFWKFKNPNFPSPEHVKTIMVHPDVKIVNIPNSPIPYPVLAEQEAKVKKAINFYLALGTRDSCDNIRARLNEFYDEAGPDENNAKDFSLQYDTLRGGNRLVAGGGKLALSSSCAMLGGKKYTVGLEVETSAGILTESDCKKIQFDLVGDSSIGSGEYTSPPMHGDNCYTMVKRAMNVFAAKTLVDNRCSVHIHVGGAKDPEGKDRVWTPTFNTEFGINAVKLGAQLEDELFASMPPYRMPDIKYCSGIKRFGHIDRDNWRKVLGAYVFGPEVEALQEADITGGAYEIGRSRNSEQEQNRWCSGRYKWLNLVNAFSKGRFATIEFRIFGATTSFEKVYNYILTSLAFVWFVENRPALINKGKVTLNLLFDEAYSDYPKLAEQLKTFYAERKKRFAKARLKAQP
jgi:hypothetical protein